LSIYNGYMATNIPLIRLFTLLLQQLVPQLLLQL